MGCTDSRVRQTEQGGPAAHASTVKTDFASFAQTPNKGHHFSSAVSSPVQTHACCSGIACTSVETSRSPGGDLTLPSRETLFADEPIAVDDRPLPFSTPPPPLHPRYHHHGHAGGTAPKSSLLVHEQGQGDRPSKATGASSPAAEASLEVAEQRHSKGASIILDTASSSPLLTHPNRTSPPLSLPRYLTRPVGPTALRSGEGGRGGVPARLSRASPAKALRSTESVENSDSLLGPTAGAKISSTATSPSMAVDSPHGEWRCADRTSPSSAELRLPVGSPQVPPMADEAAGPTRQPPEEGVTDAAQQDFSGLGKAMSSPPRGASSNAVVAVAMMDNTTPRCSHAAGLGAVDASTALQTPESLQPSPIGHCSSDGPSASPKHLRLVDVCCSGSGPEEGELYACLCGNSALPPTGRQSVEHSRHTTPHLVSGPSSGSRRGVNSQYDNPPPEIGGLEGFFCSATTATTTPRIGGASSPSWIAIPASHSNGTVTGGDVPAPPPTTSEVVRQIRESSTHIKSILRKSNPSSTTGLVSTPSSSFAPLATPRGTGGGVVGQLPTHHSNAAQTGSSGASATLQTAGVVSPLEAALRTDFIVQRSLVNDVEGAVTDHGGSTGSAAAAHGGPRQFKSMTDAAIPSETAAASAPRRGTSTSPVLPLRGSTVPLLTAPAGCKSGGTSSSTLSLPAQLPVCTSDEPPPDIVLVPPPKRVQLII